MLADAFPERAAREPHNRRRVAVSIVVLGLHLLLLFVLLHAAAVKVMPKLTRPEPTMVWFDLRPPKAEPEKKKPEPPTEAVTPPVSPFDTTAPITIPPPRPRSGDEDGLGRFGRYLNNCSAGNYEKLTPQEWADCLGGLATRRDPGTVTLGDVRTLWEKQHPPKPRANPDDADGFVECAHNDPKRLMGLPCFQHNGRRPTILNGQQ